MNWQYVEIDEVYLIHQAIIKRAGTKAIVRDFALLHSAVERPKATYCHRDLYPTLFAKAASLLQSICLNHPFSDGNKRTAYVATHRFLWLNGYHLKPPIRETVDFMVCVDNKKPFLAEIVSFLHSHSRKRKKK